MLSPLFGGVAVIFIVAAALVYIASPFLLLAGLYYVFIPARRKKVAEEKNRELFLSTLQKNDGILLACGTKGTIEHIDSQNPLVRISTATDVAITLDKKHIVGKLSS